MESVGVRSWWLVAAAALAAAAGVRVLQLAAPHAAHDPVREMELAAPGAGAQQPTAEQRAQAWVRRVMALDPNAPDGAVLRSQLRLLVEDHDLRARLIARYRQEADEPVRRMLAGALAATHAADVAHLSLQLAEGDTAQRSAAYTMLAAAPPTPQAQGVLREALARETDPRLLGLALAALRPGESVPPSEVRLAVEVLQRLLPHQDPGVRAGCIAALAAWDPGSRDVEAALRQGLSDPSPQVRSAAADAAAGRMRSDAMRVALMSLLRDANEAPAVRRAAARALEGWVLPDADYAAYRAAREDLSRLP